MNRYDKKEREKTQKHKLTHPRTRDMNIPFSWDLFLWFPLFLVAYSVRMKTLDNPTHAKIQRWNSRLGVLLKSWPLGAVGKSPSLTGWRIDLLCGLCQLVCALYTAMYPSLSQETVEASQRGSHGNRKKTQPDHLIHLPAACAAATDARWNSTTVSLLITYSNHKRHA